MTETATTRKPTRFWINSMGEYGVRYDDGTEDMGGSININELAESHGKSDPDQLTAEHWKRAWDHLLWTTVSNHIEVSVYRAWEHLQPLENGVFRFYGGVQYEGQDAPKPYLVLTTEYIHAENDTAFWDKLRELARSFGANTEADGDVLEDMMTHTRTGYTVIATNTYVPDEREGETDWQVAVNFDVFGKSFGEVAALQTRWAIAALHLDGDRVTVI